jgi:hypothetical protein
MLLDTKKTKNIYGLGVGISMVLEILGVEDTFCLWETGSLHMVRTYILPDAT